MADVGNSSELDQAGSIAPLDGDAVHVGTVQALSETANAIQAATPLQPGVYVIPITATRDSDGATTTVNVTYTVLGPGVNVSVNDASETDTAEAISPELFAVLAGPSGNVQPGDLVSITIAGDGTETLSCSAGSIPVVSNDGTTLTFNAPEPPLFGDKTLNYLSAIEITVTQGANSDTFNLVIEPRASEQFAQISAIDPAGIYANDTLSIGDYAHARNIGAGVDVDLTDGTYTVTAAASLEYALYDGAWSTYVTENFAEPNQDVNVGSASETDSANSIAPEISSPPVLSNLQYTVNASGDVTITLDTSAADGVLRYAFTTLQFVAESKAQILSQGSQRTVIGSGQQVFNYTGLTPETEYYFGVYHSNSEGESNLVSIGPFNTVHSVSINTGTATETNTANATTPQIEAGDIVVSLDTAEETDSANSIAAPQEINTGSAEETDTSNTIVGYVEGSLISQPRTVIEIIIPDRIIEFDAP